MKNFSKHSIILLALLLFGLLSKAQLIDGKGQLIGWLTVNPDNPFAMQAGARYLPSLLLDKQFENSLSLDGEFTLNAYGSSLFWGNDSTDLDGNIKPYRGWVRFSGDQFEVRAGLQKLNFGSASILRPLMWFDQIDPRDPLQMTTGVDGLLFRYYFLNNANIWVWGLYGNDELKGWDNFKTQKNKPEVGGRIQIPLLKGEIATTYHYREGNLKGSFADSLTLRNSFSENRIALDGKFDWEIGFWFEGALIHQNLDFTTQRYQRMLNLGVDYTFAFGNGLSVIGEYFTYQSAEEAFGKGDGIGFGALSLSYPINFINNLQAIVYYDFTNNDIYRFLNFSWTYDNWMIYVMAFWNPDKFQINQNVGETNLYGGYGAQVMLVFNH